MKQTTIMLPTDLKMKAILFARARQISLGELIREALDKILNSKKKSNKKDAFFSDCAIFTGDVPSDISEKHDAYLYGEDA